MHYKQLESIFRKGRNLKYEKRKGDETFRAAHTSKEGENTKKRINRKRTKGRSKNKLKLK